MKLLDDPGDEEPEPEGHDLMDFLEQDMMARPELDRYSSDILDDADYAVMTAEQKRLADLEIRQKEKEMGQFRGRGLALLSSDFEEEEALRSQKRRRKDGKAAIDDGGEMGSQLDAGLDMGFLDSDQVDSDEELYEEEPLKLEEVQGSLREWILLDNVRREMERRFKKFLREFVDASNSLKYVERIRQMCSANKESLEVNWQDFWDKEPTMAEWIGDAPSEMIPFFDEVLLKEVTRESNFPDYARIAPQIYVRFTDLPLTESLRDLRNDHLNVLVRVTGVVTRRTSVFPQIRASKYNCSKCGNLLGPYPQDSANKEVMPAFCSECQSRGPFVLNAEHTIYRNFQKITLQESPGTVPAGRLPRSKDVILVSDLIDSVKPGDECEITGIYKNALDKQLNVSQGFPVFKTLIEANYIYKHHDLYENFRLTESDERTIRKFSKDPKVADKIISSIAPSIYGHVDIKTAIALALFGGEGKLTTQNHKLRGDINVLLLGDPGTAKSQFLKYTEKIAYRAVYTTGKGASAVGLTASVHKDPITREWTLEGGALVLADRGVCMIDEFDKMNDQDRTSIHEAMEQQSISISKAGIVTTLQARCSVIAAANPVRGRYDPTLSFMQNVELSDAILSRFDILCVVRDTVDPEIDRMMADFVVRSHVRSHPEYQEPESDSDESDYDSEGEDLDEYSEETRELKEKERLKQRLQRKQEKAERALEGGDEENEEERDSKSRDRKAKSADGIDGLNTRRKTVAFEGHISQELLRKYILFAKSHVHPKLDRANTTKLSNLFVELRKEPVSGGMPMTVRHLESMIRMAEAHAKMHLREYVNDDDVNMAIRVTLSTFISSQKYAIAQQLERTFAKYITLNQDDNDLVMQLLQRLLRESLATQKEDKEIVIDVDELEARAREYHITSLRAFFKSKKFRDSHFFYNHTEQTITYMN